MAAARGFADLNPYEGAAGVVLPESQTVDAAIDNIKQNGILVNKQRAVNQQYQAQVNKDFATNKLSIAPTIQYNSELSGLAQKWYDKGVQYRRQNFDPFNPNYNNSSQVKASEEYMAEKKHIEDLADLAKGVDKDYNENKKLHEQGKLENFDEYADGLKKTSLQELYSKGGMSALPTLSPRYDPHKVDANIKIIPNHAYSQEPVPGMPAGTFTNVDHEYVDMKRAARITENAMLDDQGFRTHLKKMGIDNVDQLYTKGGHFMKYNNNDPSDFGEIDQPALMHAISVDMLTNPEQIKNLPASVKQKIVADANWDKNPLNASGLGLQAGGAGPVIKKPNYDPTDDPDFQRHLMTQFDKQLKKESTYLNLVVDRLGNNMPELKDKTKTDATLANLMLRKQGLGISQANLNLRRQEVKDREAKAAGTSSTDDLIEETRTGQDRAGAWNAFSKIFEGNPNYKKGLNVKEDTTDPNKVTVTIPGKLTLNPNYDPDWQKHFGSKSQELQDKNSFSKLHYVRGDETKIPLDRSKPAEYHANLQYLKKIAGGDKVMKNEGKLLHKQGEQKKKVTDLTGIFGK